MRFISLEKKLPLLIGGLVAAALIVTLAVVHVELRQSAIDSAGERLGIVTSQLVEIADASIGARAGLLRRVALDPVVTRLAAAGEGDVDEVLARLQTLRSASDSGLAIGLWSRDGRLIVGTGLEASGPRAAGESLSLTTLPVPDGRDDVTFSELSEHDGRVSYWLAATVHADGQPVGHVAQQRVIAQSSAGAVIESIIGGSAEVFFTNANGGTWTQLTADGMTAAPEIPVVGEVFEHRGRSNRGYFAYAAAMAGTPWLIVVRVPRSAVLGQSSRVMQRLVLISTLVLLLGGLGAWLVSRSVTTPLGRLGAAADVVATGDYSGRTGVDRDDEIGRLARSFDAMAVHVEAAHGELARRYEQSQNLAAQLEQTNLRLTRAMEDAETARAEAQKANRVKSEFLATMSHEIRTPINAVVGYADLLELGVQGEPTDGQREYLSRIRLSSEHLISVVNDVLDFAKVESGQMRIQRRPGDAMDEISAAVAMLQAEAATKKMSVSIDCNASGQYLGDPQRVQQILLNLLSNAIKFSGDGGQVSVTCARQVAAVASPPLADVCTCITVADNGPGISPGLHEAIFHPFVQTQTGYTRPHGGTGLGLAISRSLARMMSGDLTVDSAPGRGSAFTLRLPTPEHART